MLLEKHFVVTSMNLTHKELRTFKVHPTILEYIPSLCIVGHCAYNRPFSKMCNTVFPNSVCLVHINIWNTITKKFTNDILKGCKCFNTLFNSTNHNTLWSLFTLLQIFDNYNFHTLFLILHMHNRCVRDDIPTTYIDSQLCCLYIFISVISFLIVSCSFDS